jgi:hypothetical protein
LLAAASPDALDEVQETLRLIKERREAARIAQDIEKSPSPLQDYRQDDEMDIEYFGNEDPLQDDAEMPYEDEPAPEVAELFQLEAAGLAEVEDVVGEPGDEEDWEEEEPQFRWDQAGPDEDIEDEVLRVAEDEQWEEIQRLLLECREFLVIFHKQSTYSYIEDEGMSDKDLADIKGLAYNLKHSHSREALEDLAKLMKLRSPYIMKKKLQHFSGLEEESYDCCINSYMLFAGPFADLDACKICSEPRRDNRGKARNVFRYLPIIPRLQAFFQSQRIIEMLRYCQELGPYDGTFGMSSMENTSGIYWGRRCVLMELSMRIRLATRSGISFSASHSMASHSGAAWGRLKHVHRLLAGR